MVLLYHYYVVVKEAAMDNSRLPTVADNPK